MITITNNAKNKLLDLMKESNLNNNLLRVGVKGGGCSGLSYILEFDTKTSDTDELFESNGIRVVCDKKSLLYIFGTELDYSDGLNGKGFEWVNPNASRKCGCGSSFAV